MPRQTQGDDKVLHLIVGDSAGGSLRQGLRLDGRKERIAAFYDDLSFGPIDPGDTASRLAWISENLGVLPGGKSHVAAIKARIDAFWDTMLSASGRRLLWVTRRSACSYAGFLEWLWRLGDMPFEVVDVTDADVTRSRGERAPVRSLGEISPAFFAENALWDRAIPLSSAERERYHAMWQKLRAENAPFRVAAGDDLISAPVTAYDELLLSCTTDQWRKAASIVGDSLCTAHKLGLDVGDLVLLGRVRALAAQGLVEVRGNLSELRFGELRLPQR